jgi:ABC-type dipeptide/oligopeptide/nickel transport system ATPase component
VINLDKPNITSLFDLLKGCGIVSISGESGTGKTTLALQLITSTLIDGNFDDQAVWIQASEQFPKKRLISLFHNVKGKSSAYLKKIFLFPTSTPFLTYEEQSTFLTTLGVVMLPFNTKYLVIDNISHHLRLATSCCSNYRQRTALLDEFFSSQLFPIIMRCLREDIVLILIHEVSFDPVLGKNRMFFNKLYSRINSVNVFLSKPFRNTSKTKRMELKLRDNETTSELRYKILERGISLV